MFFKNIKPKKSLLLTVLLLLSFTALSASFSSPITQFSIKPVSCIVNQQGDTCQLNATVEWQASDAIDVCLLQDDIQLHCWPTGSYGKKMLPVELNANSQFTLVQNNEVIVASQQIVIASLIPIKKRRRLRSSWSIF